MLNANWVRRGGEEGSGSTFEFSPWEDAGLLVGVDDKAGCGWFDGEGRAGVVEGKMSLEYHFNESDAFLSETDDYFDGDCGIGPLRIWY